MKTLALLVALLTLSTACSSSPKDDGRTGTSEANPCATPGATYLQTATTVSGDCGDIPDQIFNVGNDGTMTQEVRCDRIEQDGCRAHNTGCRSTGDNGCSVTQTFETTFEDDGSSASGIMSLWISCPDGSGCSGTYEYEMTRR